MKVLEVLRKIKHLHSRQFERENNFEDCYEKNITIANACEINNSEFGEFCNVAHHASVMNAKIGKRTSIGRYSKIRDAEIGTYCSISWDVTIGAVSHPSTHISSHAFTYRKQFAIVEEDIFLPQQKTIIGNDVWIGCNSVIISGIKVGDGAIIGAGAVVTKDVEPYSVVVGVPAHKLRYRFSEDIISRLIELKWWDFDDQIIMKNIDLFKADVNSEIIEKLEEIKGEYI